MADGHRENPAEEGFREAGDDMAESVGAAEKEHAGRGDPYTAREGLPTGEMHELTADEEKARKRRNIAIALGVVAFVVLVFATTVLRLSENIAAGGAG